MTRALIKRIFRKLSPAQRVAELHTSGYLDQADCAAWLSAAQSLPLSIAEHMIENVIGVFGLPQGIAINFPIDGQRYAIPMVVEEPSVVAALSYAGLLAEKSGGFRTQVGDPVLHGQIQLIGIEDISAATAALESQQGVIVEAANALMPAMVARGGGAQSMSLRRLEGRHGPMLVLNLSIDTRDAMGANQVNTVMEQLAPLIERISGGQALLKILSNLADAAISRAEVRYAPAQLATKTVDGHEVARRIVLANDFAWADPYRATTHNKGIMNGIDPLVLATGNDWRAVEAAVHAYAARDGQYRGLTEWEQDDDGSLVGRIALPLKVGTVGASLRSNPVVDRNLRLLGVTHATELAGVMAAVGLAQNFAALRALVTSGIQQGHMTLHARSVAVAAHTPAPLFDEVVKRLVECGDIKVRRAEQIIAELQDSAHDG